MSQRGMEILQTNIHFELPKIIKTECLGTLAKVPRVRLNNAYKSTLRNIYDIILYCCVWFPRWGRQQSACVNSRPPDRSVHGVYTHQAAVLPVLLHTFAPGLSWAATTSTLHFHLFNSCDGARGSADMPVPAEPSSTSGRGDLLQPEQGI